MIYFGFCDMNGLMDGWKISISQKKKLGGIPELIDLTG